MIKKIIAIALLLALFTISSCENNEYTNEDVNDTINDNWDDKESVEDLDYMEDIVGDWKFEYTKYINSNSIESIDITIRFNKDYTGLIVSEGTNETLPFAWSYDMQANRYAIYVENDEYIRYVSISKETDSYTMHFGDLTGIKGDFDQKYEEKLTLKIHTDHYNAYDLSKLNNELKCPSWEPGLYQIYYMSVTNNTDSAVSYSLCTEVREAENNLFEVIEYSIVQDLQITNPVGRDFVKTLTYASLVDGMHSTNVNNVTILPKSTVYFAVITRMSEFAGNEYQNASLRLFIYTEVND